MIFISYSPPQVQCIPSSSPTRSRDSLSLLPGRSAAVLLRGMMEASRPETIPFADAIGAWRGVAWCSGRGVGCATRATRSRSKRRVHRQTAPHGWCPTPRRAVRFRGALLVPGGVGGGRECKGRRAAGRTAAEEQRGGRDLGWASRRGVSPPAAPAAGPAWARHSHISESLAGSPAVHLVRLGRTARRNPPGTTLPDHERFDAALPLPLPL